MPPIANLDYVPILRARIQILSSLTNGPELTTRGLHDTSIGHTTSFYTGSRFTGRRVGGATRDHIYGESYYGSGYPYGSYGSTWVGGRPFPFYYWPIYVGPYEYYGASEYVPPNSTDRPGGPMHTVAIFTLDPKYNTSDIYHLLGDKESVNVVLVSLREECSIVGGPAVDYNPASNKSSHKVPRVESIIQYYRASSFALALDGFNNSAAAVTPAALANNTGQLTTSLPTPTPLPSSINPMFLDCINRTVGIALPLIDPGLSDPSSSGGGSDSAGAMIACMHLVLLVVLVSGLIKGVASWLSTVRQERGALLDRVADLVSMVSAFSW